MFNKVHFIMISLQSAHSGIGDAAFQFADFQYLSYKFICWNLSTI